MKMTNKIISAVFALSFLSAGLAISNAYAPSAFAQGSNAKSVVDDAKAQGLVGEQIDGYLGLITGNAPANVQAAVNEINIRRKSVYTRLARDKNVSIASVSGVSGEKLIAKAKFGQMVQGNNGAWRKVR